jgi:hypothetical protein
MNHYETVLTGHPKVLVFETNLPSMYSGALTPESIYKLHLVLLNNQSNEVKDSAEVNCLTEKTKMYGSKQFSKGYNLEDAC